MASIAPLSPEQIRTVHGASLKILETTGITYEQGLEDTVQMLEDDGATIDRDRKKIRFPKDLIIEQAAKSPEKVVLCGQDPKHDLYLTENRVYLGTGGAAIKILDLETGEARSTKLKDLYEVSKLVDQLDNIHFLVRPCIPTDINETDYDVNMFYTCLSGSSKHVMSGVSDEQGLHNIIEMASIIAGGLENLQKRPFISVINSFAISPLKLCTQSTRIMQEAIDSIGPGGNFMTSPHTMKYLKTEHYYGNGVTDRISRDKWEQEGSPDCRHRAVEIAKKMLSIPRPAYISKEIDTAIRDKFNILLSA